MTHYLIYKITNLVNGKMYIGKHKTDNIDDGYTGSGKILKYAIKKYGIECFRKDYLMFCEDEEEMNYMERVFVDQTWIDRADTYNLKLGGEGGGAKGIHSGVSLSEEHKAKISKANKGRNNPMYGRTSPNKGKKHTDETKRKMGERKLGHQVSEETRRKISKSKQGQLAGVKLSSQHKNKIAKSHIGLRWYTDGKTETATKECPNGFRPGRLRIYVH